MPLIDVAIALSLTLGEKGASALLSAQRGKLILWRATKKTAKKFSSSTVRSEAYKDYLTIWIKSKYFSSFIKELENGESIELIVSRAVDSFISIPQFERKAQEVLAYLFKQIDDGLLKSQNGLVLLSNRLLMRLDNQSDEIKVGYEEIIERLEKRFNEQNDTINDLKSSLDFYNAPQKKAIQDFLSATQEWNSIKQLLDKGSLHDAKREIETRLNKLNEIYTANPSSEKIFKDHHIELLLKLSSLHSNLGEFSQAHENYLNAKNKGIVTPSLKRLESKVLINLNKISEFESLVKEGELTELEIAEMELLMLNSQWGELLKRVPNDSDNFRIIYLGLLGRIESYDDVTLSQDAVKLQQEIYRANELTGAQPLHKIQIANIAINFLRRISFGMIETPELNRAELVLKTREYIDSAINSCKKVNYRRGLVIVLDSALKFYSMLEEEEAIRATEIAIKELDEDDEAVNQFEIKRGVVSKALELHNKAVSLMKGSEEEDFETIEHFFQAAFELSTKEEKQVTGQTLINFYIQGAHLDKAESVLQRLSEINKHSKALIELGILERKEGTESLFKKLEVLVSQFPSSIQFRRYYIDILIDEIKKKRGVEPAKNNQELLDEINQSVNILNKLLPTDANQILIAEALIADKDFNNAIRVLKNVSPATKVYISSLRYIAHCLIETERVNEVPQVFEDLADLTHDPRYINEAAKYYLNYNKGLDAYTTLNKWIERFPEDPYLNANLAVAITLKQNVTNDEGRRAFNLLSRAYKLKAGLTSSFLYFHMGRAAGIAGKQNVAQRYFSKHWATIPSMSVTKKADFEQLNELSSDGSVRMDLGGKAGIKAFVEWNSEFTSALNTFHRNDLMTYVDTFARNGQPWRQWIGWTSAADEVYYKNNFSHSIKSPWPYSHKFDSWEKGILLDLTALLSLCILSKTDRIIRELKDLGYDLFLRNKELRNLRRAVIRQEEVLFEIKKYPYDELLSLLNDNGVIQEYSADLWNKYYSDVPQELHEVLGNHVSDLGLSLSLDQCCFILDKVDGMEGESEVLSVLTSSKQLLRSLVDHGLIGENEADFAANKNSRFEGWRNTSPIELPKNVVFSAFSIEHWNATGLLTVANSAWIKNETPWPKIHLGPFGSAHLIKEATLIENEMRMKSLASNQLSELENLVSVNIIEVLTDIEVPSRDSFFFRSSNTQALSLLELAKSKELNLWTDDRVIGYLLWPFNHPLPFEELREEFSQLNKEYSSVDFLTTENILEIIQGDADTMEDSEFIEAGYRLVELGYRPLNFLLAVNYLLNNFRYNPVLPKYKAFLSTLEGHLVDENYDSESKVDYRPQQRLFLAKVVPGVIAGILLRDTRMPFDERKKFASDILSVMIKYVDRHRNEMKDKMPSFWVSLLHEIVDYKIFNRVSIDNENDFQKSLDGAIDWFTESISKFEKGENLNRAIIAIEDFLVKTVTQFKVMSENIDAAQKFGVSEKGVDTNIKSLISRRILLLIRPLLHQDLIDKFNPLLRRCLGHISSFPHEFKLDEVYWFDDGIKKAKDQIPEDELELFVIGIFEDILNGSPEYGRFLTGDLRVFCTWNRLKPKEFRTNKNDTYGVSINISMIRLILRDELHGLPKIIETIVSQLQLIDPILGQFIQKNSNNLISKDTEIRRNARESVAFSIVSSVYFELQRNLPHAFSKLQELDTDELDNFLSPKTGWVLNDNHPSIYVSDQREYPRGLMVELIFLTSDLDVLYQGCASIIELNKSDIAKDTSENFDEIGFYTRILGEEISSFKLGYRFLEFLIMVSKGEEMLNFNGKELTPVLYLKEYLSEVLKYETDSDNDSVDNVYRSKDLKTIYCSLLRLAVFVNGSVKHTSTWENEFKDTEKTMLKLVHSNLIFSNRLLPILSSKYNNDFSYLKEDLVDTVKKLSIHFDDAVDYYDRFNPFILAPHLLDQEVASIMHSLIAYIMYNEKPELVLDLKWLIEIVEPWTKSLNQEAEETYENQKEKSLNVIGIKIPLSPKEAAEKLIEAIKSRSEKIKSEKK